MGRVYTEMNWVIYNAVNKEIVGCQEREDGGMTPVMTVGIYQERSDGQVLAKLLLDGVKFQTTGKNFGELSRTPTTGEQKQ